MRGRLVIVTVLALVVPLLVPVAAEAAPSCFGPRATIVGTRRRRRARGHGVCGNDLMDGRDGYDVLVGGGGTDACVNGEELEECET